MTMSPTEEPAGDPSPSSRVRFRIPGEGRLWLLATGGLFAIGLAKGHNLLVILAYFMLLLWSVNAFAAGRGLGNLQARRHLEWPVFARTPCGLTIALTNTGPRDVIGLRVEDRAADERLAWFRIRLGAGESITLSQEITLSGRGRQWWPALSASSGYPYGLARRVRTLTPAETVVVLPQLGRIHRGRLRQFLNFASPAEDRFRSLQRPHPMHQGEMHSLRPMRSGDSPRWIHWRTTARRGEPMVREFEGLAGEDLILVVEPWLPSELEDDAPALLARQILEGAISLAASICWEWCRQRGDQLVLVVAGPQPVVLRGITGPEHARRMLECLAETAGTEQADMALLSDETAARHLPRAAVLAISTRPDAGDDVLAARWGRPVARVFAGGLDGIDFYEGPVSCGSTSPSSEAST